uniref:Discs, large (Drosophila) homolog-associated protein 2a n=1 Tax=Eptatretus burgeri TaxID=7764 RepID=A0A8C4WZ07_EPTBU
TFDSFKDNWYSSSYSSTFVMPGGSDNDIPCRRMRSGSYIKAMDEESEGDLEGETDVLENISPQGASRRASYLKATGQKSLSESTGYRASPKVYTRSHSYLRAVSEVSINHSMESLGPSTLLASPKFRSRNESYMRAMSSISQVSELEVNGQFEAMCESVFSEMEAQTVEALDLPACFRTRSHSYLRAIQAGYTYEEETTSTVPSSTPSPTPTTISTIKTVTITTYKKTPPPVPPRTTSKPLISVTTQSSTESAQDSYCEQGSTTPHHDTEGLSNSSESLDSAKALTAAMDAAAAQIHGPRILIHQGSTMEEDEDEDEIEDQDYGMEAEVIRKPLRKLHRFQSIGIQVEDEKRYDDVLFSHWCLVRDDGHGPLVPSFTAIFVEPNSAEHTVPLQVELDDGLPDFDPAGLPPPDSRHDGPWFARLLRAERERMEGWCLQMEQEARDNELPQEVLLKITTAVNSAHELMTEKFQQFHEICYQCMDPIADAWATSQDMAHFWESLQLSIEDISLKFDELFQLKVNDWRLAEAAERKTCLHSNETVPPLALTRCHHLLSPSPPIYSLQSVSTQH